MNVKGGGKGGSGCHFLWTIYNNSLLFYIAWLLENKPLAWILALYCALDVKLNKFSCCNKKLLFPNFSQLSRKPVEPLLVIRSQLFLFTFHKWFWKQLTFSVISLIKILTFNRESKFSITFLDWSLYITPISIAITKCWRRSTSTIPNLYLKCSKFVLYKILLT